VKVPFEVVSQKWRGCLMRNKDKHKLARESVESVISEDSKICRATRRALRSAAPFDYDKDRYWYRVWLKYRNEALDKIAQGEAAKQMELF
jgi:hypothetical protein